MNKKKGVVTLSVLFFLVTATTLGILTYYFQSRTVPQNTSLAANQIIITDPPTNGNPNLQMQTFRVITVTPSPTPIPSPTNIPPTNVPGATNAPPPTIPVGGSLPLSAPRIGGPIPGANEYCIDDQDPDMCDDSSSHLVPKGAGGISGSCGTVIEQVHKLVAALPQYEKGLRNALESSITNCSYTAQIVSAPNYVSTYLVIDAYGLAGIPGLDRASANQVSPSGLFSWWQSAPAGFEFVSYSSSVIQQFASGAKDLTGCVMFLRTSSSYHIGIVNKFELYTSGGDGIISILQSGTSMYIDRFPVAGWNVENNSTNQTNTQGVAGFGCHS